MKEIAKGLTSLIAIVESKNRAIEERERIASEKEARLTFMANDLSIKDKDLRQREQNVAAIERIVDYNQKCIDMNKQNLKDKDALDAEKLSFSKYVQTEKIDLETKRAEINAEIKRLNDLKNSVEYENAIEKEVVRRLAVIVSKK